MSEKRAPKIGERVAIPGHAIIFVIKKIDKENETADAERTTGTEKVERSLPWSMLTFIDPEIESEVCELGNRMERGA